MTRGERRGLPVSMERNPFDAIVDGESLTAQDVIHLSVCQEHVVDVLEFPRVILSTRGAMVFLAGHGSNPFLVGDVEGEFGGVLAQPLWVGVTVDVANHPMDQLRNPGLPDRGWSGNLVRLHASPQKGGAGMAALRQRIRVGLQGCVRRAGLLEWSSREHVLDRQSGFVCEEGQHAILVNLSGKELGILGHQPQLGAMRDCVPRVVQVVDAVERIRVAVIPNGVKLPGVTLSFAWGVPTHEFDQGQREGSVVGDYDGSGGDVHVMIVTETSETCKPINTEMRTTLNEDRYSQAQLLVKNHDCAALTAWVNDASLLHADAESVKSMLQQMVIHHGNGKLPPEILKAANHELFGKIRRMGYLPFYVLGRWRYKETDEPTDEESIFVADVNDLGTLRDDALALGTLHNQQSILFIPRGGAEGELIATGAQGTTRGEVTKTKGAKWHDDPESPEVKRLQNSTVFRPGKYRKGGALEMPMESIISFKRFLEDRK